MKLVMKGGAPTASQIKAAMEYEREHGSGSDADKARKVANHLSERPTYYDELERMLDVPMHAKSGDGAAYRSYRAQGYDAEEADQLAGKMGGGPFIGPKGGKWADPQFTIPWQEGGQPQQGAGEQPPKGKPPTGPQQPAAQPKQIPSADQIGAQGQQVIAAVRKTNPEAAQALEQSLTEIVTGLRARQAGAKSPEGDNAIIENLKAFGRAFNQSAAPSGILGPDLGGMLEAAERARKRDEAEESRAQSNAMADAAGRAGDALSSVKPGEEPDPDAPEVPARAGAEGAGGEAAEPAAGGAGAGADAGPELGFRDPGDDDGVVDLLGIGSPDEVNRKFGVDPKAQERDAAAHAALERLDAQQEAAAAAEQGDTAEGAVAEALATAQQGQATKQARAQEREGFDRDLQSMRMKRDRAHAQAAAQAERFAARNKGRKTEDVAREQLGGPEEAPSATRAARADMKTAPRLRRSLLITPSLLKAMINPQHAPAHQSAGPTGGGTPPTPSIPDYQSIYFQPPTDERKRQEEEALANRRRTDGERTSGVYGFHGTGEVRLDPVLYYVPQIRPVVQHYGAPQIAQRGPVVVSDMIKPRLEAGGEAGRGEVKGGAPVQAQTDAGRVPRSPDRRDDALAPTGQQGGEPEEPRARAPEHVRAKPAGDEQPTTERGRVHQFYRDRGQQQGGGEGVDRKLAGLAARRAPAQGDPPEHEKAEEDENDEDTQRARAIVARMSDEQVGSWTREGLVGFIRAGFRNARAFGISKSEVVLEALHKGGAHKYIRRVPTGNPKRPWRYYYAESAIARDAKAGEEVRVGKQIAKVLEVGKDGSIRIEMAGREHSVKPDEWANLLARAYGNRYHEWAEKRAEQSINAVLKHVPRKLLEDLPGETDEERFAQLQKRVPSVYAKLERSFERAGVNPFRAKRILATALERRGWEPEARAAAVGSVLTRKTDATRFSEIVQGAENLAGGARVTAGHVGAVVELRGGGAGEDDFASRVADIAKRAEAELAQLSALLAKAHDGSNTDRANALAAALASSAIQKLNLLTTAFPGLRDRVADEARGVMLEAASVTPHAAPKREGGETHVYVAGENGQPKAVKARYVLMEAEDIVASHDPTKGFKKRDDYPEGVQERAYHRDQSEQGKVIRNAQTLNPAFVVNTNPDAVNGPPVITKDGHALGGNSRTMSMQLAYAQHPEKASELRSYLAEHAHEVGFRAEDVQALKNPVLVRVIEPEDTSKQAQQLLVRQLNESFTQGMDPRTMQVAMGRKVDEAALSALGSDMNADETLAAFLATGRSERFVNALMRAGIIDQRNANQYMKKGTKLLNEDGRTLVERILVGRLVGDADILSNTGARLMGNIANAVPYMMQAKAHGSGYDVGSDLAVALSAYNDLQHRVETGAIPALDPKMPEQRFNGLFNYFDSLFGDKHPVVDNKNARAMLELLIRKPGPQQQAGVWRDFVKRAAQNPEGQSSMFGASKTPSEVLRDTIASALRAEEPAKEEPKPKAKKDETPSLF